MQLKMFGHPPTSNQTERILALRDGTSHPVASGSGASLAADKLELAVLSPEIPKRLPAGHEYGSARVGALTVAQTAEPLL